MDDGFIFALIILIVAVTTYKIISLKHRSSGKSVDFQHLLAQELSDRDDKANALDERIRVLEKIVTDKHSASSLSDEIEQLKNQKNDESETS